MLPLAHIYISTKVTKRKSSLLIFGSVLPDISWTSESEIGRDQIHYSPEELYKYVSKKNPKMIDLAVGVRLHSNINKGADYYSDDLKEGFAYLEGKKINSKVASLLRREPDKKSLTLAHNIIEAGVDLNLLESKPKLLEWYKKSVKEVDYKKISLLLSNYLGKDKEVIEGEMKKFIGFIGPHAYDSKKSLSEKVALLISGRLGAEVDRGETLKLLEESKEIMKYKYKDYLDKAIKNMKIDFKDLVG